MNILKNNYNLSRWILLGIACVLISEILFLFNNVFYLQLLKQMMIGQQYTYEALDSFDRRENIILFLYYFCFFSTVILFIVWKKRAYQNLIDLGLRMTYTSGWAIAYWFIPVFCLFRPFQVMKEMKIKSEQLLSKVQVPTSISKFDMITFNLWWGLWVAHGVFARTIKTYNNLANSLEQYHTGLILQIAGSILAIIITLLFFMRVKNAISLDRKILQNRRSIQEVSIQQVCTQEPLLVEQMSVK